MVCATKQQPLYMIKFMINSLKIKRSLQTGRSAFHNLFHLNSRYRHLEAGRRTRMLKLLHYLRFRVIKRNYYKRDPFKVSGKDSTVLTKLKTNGIVVTPKYLKGFRGMSNIVVDIQTTFVRH